MARAGARRTALPPCGDLRRLLPVPPGRGSRNDVGAPRFRNRWTFRSRRPAGQLRLGKPALARPRSLFFRPHQARSGEDGEPGRGASRGRDRSRSSRLRGISPCRCSRKGSRPTPPPPRPGSRAAPLARVTCSVVPTGRRTASASRARSPGQWILPPELACRLLQPLCRRAHSANRPHAAVAPVAELVDALDSKSSFLRSAGSSPARGTSHRICRKLLLPRGTPRELRLSSAAPTL